MRSMNHRANDGSNVEVYTHPISVAARDDKTSFGRSSLVSPDEHDRRFHSCAPCPIKRQEGSEHMTRYGQEVHGAPTPDLDSKCILNWTSFVDLYNARDRFRRHMLSSHGSDR